jgi:2-oxoglutarate dehydrogenase E1 component
MTPKSLLRHPKALSSLDDLANGTFQPVIDDARFPDGSREVTRLVLCSGKVYVDLVGSPDYEKAAHVALARIEELYPVPNSRIKELLDRYPAVREVCWVQEEPQNMGAWSFLAPHLTELLPASIPLRAICRRESSSPAEGSTAAFRVEQDRIVSEALAPVDPSKNDANGSVLEPAISLKEK